MIQHIFNIPRYKWTVLACYDVRETDEGKILDILQAAKCPLYQLKEIVNNIEDGMEDNGFTYSNLKEKISVVAIGYGSSNEEIMNTLAHEARHVEQHISDVYEIDTHEEERYYLIGKLMKTMYSKFRYILD